MTLNDNNTHIYMPQYIYAQIFSYEWNTHICDEFIQKKKKKKEILHDMQQHTCGTLIAVIYLILLYIYIILYIGILYSNWWM